MVSRIALFGLCAAFCLAQSNTATVNGTILDLRGGAVAEASVIAVHEATGIVTAVKSNGVGLYSIPNLAVGDYKFTVEKPGFRRQMRSNLVLTTGQILEWNTTLELGPITESVNVTDTQAPVDTRTSDVTQLIDTRSIEALPLGNRRTMNIIGTTGAAVFISNEDRPIYSLAGGRMQSQMTWIDGGTGQNIRIAVGLQTIDLPAEAVQEIKVLANNYPAEYGGSAGGVVIETTRSGTNHVHGSAYEYLRNDAIDAPGFFAPVSNGAKLSPELRYHVFGGTAGGPIRRNRTFFFASYEGTRRHTSSSVSRTVPTELQRRGDFSQTFNRGGTLIPIYDPATAPRQPFPGNIIPANRLDPVALSVLNYFFHPNRAADNIAGGNNFGFNPVTGRSGEFAMGKVDHTPNDRNRLTFRYMVSLSDNYPVSNYPESPAEPGAYSFERAHYAYGSWTRILSSRQVNDLRYTYPNRTVYMASRGVGGNYPEKLGLRGVDPRAFPQFAPAGFLAIGSNTQERRQYPIEQHQVVDNLTLLRNHHALKVGGEARLSRDYEVNLPTVSGAFVFDAQPTGLGNGSGGNGLASMLLGLPTSYSVNATQALDRRSWYYSGFVHDEWMVAPGLTFNLGIRWEMDTPITDANRRMNGFDPQAINTVSGTPGVVKFAGVNGYPKRPYQFDRNNFAPRFGFAWKPLGSRNFVVRGGYGLFFAHPLDSGQPTQANLGFALSAKLVSLDNGITPPFYLRNGVPPLAMDALNDSFGAVPLGQSPSTAVSFFERNRVSGYSHQFNLMLQRQMAESFVVQAGILGNLARKLASANLNINQIRPEILGPAHHFQSDRPFPQFTDVILVAPSLGVTNYYAGLFQVEKRLTHGWSLVSNYTWSKCLGNTTDSGNPSAGTLGAENGPYSNFYNRRADYGPVENDIEHRFTLSSVYELPFGKGRRWLVKGISSRLAGGWTIGVLTTIQSGAPATAVTATGSTYAFPAGTQRPDVARNPNLSSTRRSVSRWFDTEAFSLPANYTFGNEGMGVIRAYGLVNSDFALLRGFAVTEHARLVIRIESFNGFNHTNLNPPGTIFDTPSFGAVSSAKAARQLQAGVRLVF